MNRNIEETKQNIIDASSFKEPKKIPVGADISGLAFAYAGVTYEDVIDDPVKCTEAYTKIFNDLPIDYVGFPQNPVSLLKPLQALGNNDYNYSDDKTGVTHHQAESSFFGPEAYDEILTDVNAFTLEKQWKHKYPALNLPKDQAYNALINALEEFRTYFMTNMMTNEYFASQNIFPLLDTQTFFYAPFNYFFDVYRGIKDALIDLRRRPKEVAAGCDIFWERDKYAFQMEPEVMKDPLPVALSIYHAECFLSPKQFDEYIWKYFKESIGPMMEAGKKFFLFGEGSLMHIYDKYRELPKGAAIIMPDTDDIFEVHKKIGDWATLATGADAVLLANGTKKECIDHVKRCFDTFAPGGGFMFYTNKELVSGKDAKMENLFAMYETADELSRGRG